MKKFTATILLEGYNLTEVKHALKLNMETHYCDDILLSLMPFDAKSYVATIQFETASDTKDTERFLRLAFELDDRDDKLLSLVQGATPLVAPAAPTEQVWH